MIDLEAKARELFDLVKKPHMADAGFAHILSALQSAHAAGKAEGDAAGFERGIGAAAEIIDAANREGPYQAIAAAKRILALLPSHPKEQT